MASAPVGTGTSGTIADVQFTVGACESRTAAAGSAWTSVQALAPCKGTGPVSAIACGFPGEGNEVSPTSHKLKLFYHRVFSLHGQRALYKELYKDSKALASGVILVLHAAVGYWIIVTGVFQKLE